MSISGEPSLADLFPGLPGDVIREFESGSAPDSGRPLNFKDGPSATTDDDVENYLRSIGSLRAPLKPVIENQHSPASPEFARNGRIAPPANQSVVEEADYGTGVPSEEGAPVPPTRPPSSTPTDDGGQGGQRAPQAPAAPEPDDDIPPPPGGYVPAPVAPAPQASPAGVQAPVAPAVAEQSALQQMWDTDPELRALIVQHNQRRAGLLPPTVQQPTQTYAPPIPAPQPQVSPASPQSVGIPQLDADQLADPAIRALYDTARQNSEQIAAMQATVQASNAQITQYQQDASRREFQRQEAEYKTMVEGAVSSFKTTYKIPDAIMPKLRETAGRLGAAATYMNGIHPITGAPVVPDPTKAVETALIAAYGALPETQAIEQQRIIQRAQKDFQRKSKLGGVSGSGGSGPRQPPAPTDAAGIKEAMNRDMEQMMRGEWQG